MSSVGIMASGVVTATSTDVLMEPFNNTSAWSLRGTPTITTGRTGTAVSVNGAATGLDYLLAANANEYVTFGFAWRTNTTSTTQRTVAELWSGSNSQRELLLRYDGTTAQSLSLYREATSVLLGTSSTGLFGVNTYAYIEVQARLHDTAGAATVRVNGTPVISLSNIDTRTITATTYDTLRLVVAVGSHPCLWDDLYITVGSGAAFKGNITIP